jgi:hypothetical protein
MYITFIFPNFVDKDPQDQIYQEIILIDLKLHQEVMQIIADFQVSYLNKIYWVIICEEYNLSALRVRH